MQARYHILCVGQVSAVGVVIYAIVPIVPARGLCFSQAPG